jgi:uncharacterized tellurite resistance protein B-like protein
MFEKITAFFQSLNADGNEETGEQFDKDDPRLAAAALMHHVIEADGVLHDAEKAKFSQVLKDTYALDGKDLRKLVAAARDADSEAIDLYQFTSVLMRMLSAEERLHFIELLWEMVYADGENHELEDNIVWRVSELLGVDGRDRVLMRQAVQARISAENG